MTTQMPVQLEESIEIAASTAQVWALVTDLKRICSWSPQGLFTHVRGGVVKSGTTFVNVNHRKALIWPTTAKVVRFTPHTDFAFRINENWTIWSFHLETTPAGGTLLTQRRETPTGIAPISNRLVDLVMGGIPTFTGELSTGMRTTLEQIRAEAER